jgi:hypothetical protein
VRAEIKARKRAKREEQLRIAERIAEICDLAMSTTLRKMKEYRETGGDAGYRLLLDPDYASKRRRGPSRALGKADEPPQSR